MKKIFMIQDVNTKEYFWQWHGEEGFTNQFDNAKKYTEEKVAVKEMTNSFDVNTFNDRVIELKTYYNFT